MTVTSLARNFLLLLSFTDYIACLPFSCPFFVLFVIAFLCHFGSFCRRWWTTQARSSKAQRIYTPKENLVAVCIRVCKKNTVSGIIWRKMGHPVSCSPTHQQQYLSLSVIQSISAQEVSKLNQLQVPTVLIQPKKIMICTVHLNFCSQTHTHTHAHTHTHTHRSENNALQVMICKAVYIKHSSFSTMEY